MNIRTEIKWAIIFIIFQLIWITLEKVMGLHDTRMDMHATVSYLFAIPAVVVYVLAMLDKRRRDFNGEMTYKQGFISGTILTIIVTILSPLTQYLVFTFISPDYFQNFITYSVQLNKFTQEEAEAYFNLKSYILQGLVGTLIMGLVTTAIVAIFVKRKRSNVYSAA